MKAILTLFLIVFIDLLGFGIIIPLFPFVAERMGADPWLITFGGAGVYALAQVIATPFWGRLSDAIGRKPVLVVSMLGAVFGYVWLAFAECKTPSCSPARPDPMRAECGRLASYVGV